MARFYRVELTLNQKELLDFIDKSGGYKSTVTAVPEETTAEPNEPESAPVGYQRRGRVIRAKRRSKVVEAILGRLRQGEADVPDLKAALDMAGMSVASLSTGLAVLQKNGQVTRGANGSYYLTEREAA